MLMKINARGHIDGMPLRGGVKRVVHTSPYWEQSILQRSLGPRQAEPNPAPSNSAKLRDRVLDESELQQGLSRVDLSTHERALVQRDGRLSWVLGPGRHVFWRVPDNVDVHTEDLHGGNDVADETASQLVVQSVRVEPFEQVRLLRDGQVIDELRPGVHHYWHEVGPVDWQVTDVRSSVDAAPPLVGCGQWSCD